MAPLTRILITGIAGFVGSHLAERLILDGHSVIGLDCFTDYYARSIKELNLANLRAHEQFTLIRGDLLELDLVAMLKQGSSDGPLSAARTNGGAAESKPIDYIFHLAAQPGVRDSWGKNFQDYTRNNILATQKLLETAREIPLKKFVYASSSSVYGDAESFPTKESMTPHPISPYGVTKLAAEHLCQLYWRNYAVPVVCLRYFTVYGPRQRPDMAFHRFIRAIQKNEEICVYGDGEQTRDFTFVGDAIEGTIRAAFTAVEGQVFNIGGGSQVTINHVIYSLEKILERKAKIRYLEPQRGDPRHTSADIHRATTALGYFPRTKLMDGLCKEAEWIQKVGNLLD